MMTEKESDAASIALRASMDTLVKDLRGRGGVDGKEISCVEACIPILIDFACTRATGPLCFRLDVHKYCLRVTPMRFSEVIPATSS